MDGAGYRELLRPLVAGRKVILAGGVAAGWTSTVGLLHQLGAADVLVIGPQGRGAGPLPDPTAATVLALDLPRASSQLDGIRAGIAALHDPPPEVVDAVRTFDPGGDALVIGTFLDTVPELDGRPFLAYRRPEWLALEDKTAVDELWDRLGVRRAPSSVVPAEPAALQKAAAAVDGGAGTVWSGDARDGFNGGAEYVRWVRTAADAHAAADFFGAHCDRVRVRPFLDGVPCSVHGIVFPDHVAALRPVELVVLRRPPGHQMPFFYAGCASFFDPPDDVRAGMRAIAVAVGVALRDEVGFRGAFTVDGVATADGFLPTELNPRNGGGLTTIARGIEGFPLQLLLDALVGGVDLGYDPRELEADLLAAADAHRCGGTWAALTVEGLAPREEEQLAFDGDAWSWARERDVAGTLTTGPAGTGSFASCSFSPAATPLGEPVAGRAAAFWAFADRALGTGVGPVSGAR